VCWIVFTVPNRVLVACHDDPTRSPACLTAAAGPWSHSVNGFLGGTHCRWHLSWHAASSSYGSELASLSEVDCQWYDRLCSRMNLKCEPYSAHAERLTVTQHLNNMMARGRPMEFIPWQGAQGAGAPIMMALQNCWSSRFPASNMPSIEISGSITWKLAWVCLCALDIKFKLKLLLNLNLKVRSDFRVKFWSSTVHGHHGWIIRKKSNKWKQEIKQLTFHDELLVIFVLLMIF
jgi:hypothetical protein